MALQLPSDGNILGVDYGSIRTGLALAGAVARLPRAYKTVKTSDLTKQIKDTIEGEDIRQVVIGIPKLLDGSETSQSDRIRKFAGNLEKSMDINIVFADETLSSVRAKQYIKDHDLPKENVDSIAACFILEEHFKQNET